ncbi:cytochrome-c oxidase, cbb3-type subunit III [Afipia carboxidovorans]|uniref:cytochrome-c oxidase, cbb3-type subunit III n=1 Tax=Afipia carboxidovorans TaxID=40137 RepID=UPI00308E4C80|nr:cytochrome-c oxidase, cbb3-type subunit III [Afipia carboxidovorans]
MGENFIRDPHTGHQTTGHEWNGIIELNTPVPRVIYFFLAITVIFAVGYWILMPTWPIGTTYTKGLLGDDVRADVTESLKQAALQRAPWTSQIESKSFAEIEKDPALMNVVRETGRTLFGDNCAACHGREAKGNKGYPNLTTQSWLWGGSPEAIAETIRVGINSTHPDTRSSQMPAFGRDGMLQRPDIDKVVAFIRSLSHPNDKTIAADQATAGKEVFAANCASCHGEDAKGNQEMGAPDLTDAFWIYGGDVQSITNTVWGGRNGHMPTWEGRLTDLDRKILALYIADLRSEKP